MSSTRMACEDVDSVVASCMVMLNEGASFKDAFTRTFGAYCGRLPEDFQIGFPPRDAAAMEWRAHVQAQMASGLSDSPSSRPSRQSNGLGPPATPPERESPPTTNVIFSTGERFPLPMSSGATFPDHTHMQWQLR